MSKVNRLNLFSSVNLRLSGEIDFSNLASRIDGVVTKLNILQSSLIETTAKGALSCKTTFKINIWDQPGVFDSLAQYGEVFFFKISSLINF